MNNPFKCTKCGRFIGIDDLEVGFAVYYILPNEDCSSYKHETFCKKCNIPKFKKFAQGAIK